MEITEHTPTTFVEFLGKYPTIKVLDFLLESVGDFSKTEIADFSGIGWVTLEELWPRLEKHKIVKAKRKIGRAVMYEFNRSNPIVKALDELDKVLAIKGLDDALEQDKKIAEIKNVARIRFPGRLEGEILGWKVCDWLDDSLLFKIKFSKEDTEKLMKDNFLTKADILEDGSIMKNYPLDQFEVRGGIVFVDFL